MTESNNKPKNNFIWVILIITIINAFVVLFLLGQGNKELSGDELQYNQLTINLIEHSSFSFETNPPYEPTIYRTPGYPLFMSPLYLLSGNSPLFVKLVHFLLFGINAFLLYQLAKLYTDELTARICSLLFLTYFPIVFLTALMVTETLALFFMLTLLLVIKKYNWQKTQKLRLDFTLGLIIGALALVRPTTSLIVIPLILSIWLPWILRRNILPIKDIFIKSVGFGFGLLLILSPWIIRNKIVSHRFVPMTVFTSSESLYLSLLQYQEKLSFAFTVDEWENIYHPNLSGRYAVAEEQIKKGEIDESLHGLPKSIQKEILADEDQKKANKVELSNLSFIQIVKRIPLRLAYLWSTADFAPTIFLHRVGQFQYLLFLIFAVAGLWLSRKKLLSHWLLLIFPIYLTIIHLIFHEEPRYTIPARPFILIYCAITTVWLWNLIRKKNNGVN